MTNSINTNIAALSAQQNIAIASNAAAENVAQLSSGNRIIKASDDVTALAIGTSLGTQVSALNTAATNATQGTSLLQVADGALAQIQTILQQMQSIASQAQSGSLTNTDRGFLNQQFQALSSEIDNLAGGTSFNGVNLIDGSISGNASINTNAANNASAAPAGGGDFVTLATAVPASGDTMTINGYTVTFTSNAYGTSGASGKVVIGATIGDTVANLAAFLNTSNAAQLANLQFVASATGLSATYTGGKLAGALTFTASANFATPANVSFTSANETIAAAGANGLGAGTYSAAGAASGALLNSPNSSSTNFGSAINVSSVLDNAAFAGGFNQLGTITGSYNGNAGKASFSITIGGIIYSTPDSTLTGATPTTLTFTGHDQFGTASGGSFTLTLAGSSVTSVGSQADANNLASQLNQGLSGVTVYQNRTVTSFQNGALVNNSSGVQVGNLSGFSVNLHASGYTNPQISSVTVTAPGVGSTDAKFTAVINGDTYTSVPGIGNQIGKNTVIGLQDVSNPNNTVSLVTGNVTIAGSLTTALDLSSQANATAVQNALSAAFGLDSANAALSFQVGSTASSTIGVSLGSAHTSALFGGASLDVSNATDAATAATTVGTAISMLTAQRSTVGALESEFNFASAALASSVQNVTAAQSGELDTNIAATSTDFATNQVKLQAGISVLAQANQQLQALLKLIG
ncbi:MAG: hypothetical protein KGI29_03165 [Pseudomonadota bacterium]|nr:hypothetical protein [Pseudomonadota bacterium]MDE3037458.1 hypothetical protein [Pseudomonadota bacterium]